VSDINERRPKKGDEDYIKRPENAFILFRRKCCEDRNLALGAGDAGEGDGSAPPTKKQRQADLSKTISQQWKSLSDLCLPLFSFRHPNLSASRDSRKSTKPYIPTMSIVPSALRVKRLPPMAKERRVVLKSRILIPRASRS
jgi:hypothetical protein